ncbi:TonB-dependent receptor [Acinetobacter sp. S40]|uniref:TonB-dependent receptor n=1 Tax=Acinetobacter sp. S40 TaxID=2767434 RepID=UPI00190BBFD7|nr:TonB-dependent receptor [Acinetobacter sp. S40]MBJ9984785.1 TonB-dependent receptor [Acinetobacter sp. S40]
MFYRFITLSFLASIHSSHAADDLSELTNLPIIHSEAEHSSTVDSIAVVKNTQAQNKTLGDMLKQISGVQSSSFGPNAGAPVIRSLTGSRVQILEDGQSILGMNALSGDINIPFDPLFIRSVTVNKSSDSVRYGGHGIGGSVDVDTGTISRKMEDKSHEIEITARKGFNDVDARGIRLNVNNQSNLSTNLLFSSQRISSYKIPGNSKADACNNQVFINNGGINSSLADSCQKEVRINELYNKASQPYIDQFMTENPDWADGQFSFYTDNPVSVWSGKEYHNPVNPDYVPGTTAFTQQKINKDITPDYKHKLGNSYLENQHFAIGSTYFFDQGYVAASLDSKDSQYGVPGFSMENKSFYSNDEGLPVGVKTKQTRYTLEGKLLKPLSVLENVEVHLAQVNNKSGEYLGASNANDYKFDTKQAELLLSQRRIGPLSGLIGLNYQRRDVKGSGSQRYLPDVNTQTDAVFIQQKLDFNWISFNAGYRHEQVDHHIQNDQFIRSRNSANSTLQDQSFHLNNYSVGSYIKLGSLFGTKVKYSVSERAPEINELYASNPHYSIMTQEEGNQNLNPEQNKSLELTGLFQYAGFDLAATVYQMKFDNYLYLGHSGMQVQNRLPLKYWKQTDTSVKGFELDLSQKIDLKQYGQFKVSALADLVKNEATNPDSLRSHNDGVYLPSMPTNRYGASLSWENQSWFAKLSSMYYDKPRYLGKNVLEEVPLSGYNLVEMEIRKTLNLKNADVDIFLNGTNLLNQEARPQNSPLKYIAPLPGRGFQLGVSMRI